MKMKTIHKPWFVASKDVINNTLTIVQDTNHPLLMSKTVETKQMHWVLEVAPKVGDKLMAQVRYRQQNKLVRLLRQVMKK